MICVDLSFVIKRLGVIWVLRGWESRSLGFFMRKCWEKRLDPGQNGYGSPG